MRAATFDVRAGEMVAFAGRNGSGKSTIAKLMDAMMRPTSGTVRVLGMDTADEGATFDIRSRIGFVFQNPADQIVNTIVENEVAFGPENLGLGTDDIRRRVDSSLGRVGLLDVAHRNVNELSGGQLQRVALADALAMEPEVLIFDETTSMLDAPARRSFLGLVQELHRGGATIIMITHAADEARIADRLIGLEDGRIAYDGAPTEDALSRFFPALPDQEELPRACCDHLFASKKLIERAPIVEFRDVSYAYGAHDEAALSGVTLSILEGESVAIMGPNGSGKSTLIMHMNGLLRPTSGIVEIGGIPTDSKDGANHARSVVGLCFQYPERQLFAQTVYEDIAFAPANAGLPDEEIDARVRCAMDDVGLDLGMFARKSPFSLSGGEQRRVALAGILAMEPRVLVMDEPCASLDPETHIEFLHLIARLRDSGRTIVIVTHDEREAASLCGRVIRLDASRIVE